MKKSDKKIPILNGLVLTGGKSSRMGMPKDQINWNGKEQRFFAADLLRNFCQEVYISCRTEQFVETVGYKFLPDVVSNIGPIGGILSAMPLDPEKAWLVVACDLPLLNFETLNYLVNNRDHLKFATAFKDRNSNFPEPLAAIWEPQGYSEVLEAVRRQKFSPRNILKNNEILLLESPFPDVLMNVNTPYEAAVAKQIINSIRK